MKQHIHALSGQNTGPLSIKGWMKSKLDLYCCVVVNNNPIISATNRMNRDVTNRTQNLAQPHQKNDIDFHVSELALKQK
jgi:hypothetical protein